MVYWERFPSFSSMPQVPLNLQQTLREDLSKDPDKNYSIFYCSVAIHFPHIETILFSDGEFINC